MLIGRFRLLAFVPILCSCFTLLLAAPLCAGVGRWTPVGPGGGIVFDLATDPNSPGTLWARAWNGVYKSTDGGATWTRKIDASDIAIDPDHPSIIYADGKSFMRSEDGGETWTEVLPGPGWGVQSLAVAPGTGTVYAAATNLKRSTDGGRTWTTVLEGGMQQVVIDPSNPRTVYAVGSSIYDADLRKSTDAGDTWASVGPVGSGSQFSGLRAVALAPSRPATLYAVSGESFYRSTDGGASWTQPSDELPLQTPTTLAVDPDSPSTVYLGGSPGVVVSTDGGVSWKRKENGLQGSTSIEMLAFSAGTPRVLYAATWGFGVAQTRDAGNHWRFGLQLGLSAGGSLVWVDPVRPDTFYVSVARGRTFRTTDGGHTWSQFATTLGDRLIQDLTVDRDHPSTLYAGTPDGLFRSSDDGASWSLLDSRPTASVGLSGNAILAADCGLRRSTDGGRTWREVISCTSEDGEEEVFVHGLQTLPGRPAVYALIQGNVSKSRSNGAFWRPTIQAVSFAVCLARPSTLYAVTFDPEAIHRSDDGGLHWTELDVDTFPYSIAVDYSNPQVVYVGGDTVLRSTDGGVTWSDVGDGLEEPLGGAFRVNLFADPTSPGHLFATTTGGGLFEATFPSP